MSKILVLLATYRRPRLVRNALRSVALSHRTHPDLEVAIVDDGSPPGLDAEPAAREILGAELGLLAKTRFVQTGDSPEDKTANGGSRHGAFLNQILRESSADIALVLCDDDVLRGTYLRDLAAWYQANPTAPSSYCHVVPFDPSKQSPWDPATEEFWRGDQHLLNCLGGLNSRTHDLDCCACAVDSSQVSWQLPICRDRGVWFPERQTWDCDASFFQQLSRVGHTRFNGLVGQYKGFFWGQMGKRKGHADIWVQDTDVEPLAAGCPE